MPLAIVIIAVGGLMVYSALKGVSIADAFAGAVGDPLDPKGGKAAYADLASENTTTGPGDIPDPKLAGQFKGPNAMLLASLAKVAQSRFNLKITQICRPQNATYGAPNSLHKACRAFDAVGTKANMLAYARYAHSTPGVSEVFYDPAGYIAPGYDHGDHVHTGA